MQITVKNASLLLKNKLILNNISFNLASGEQVAVIGHSGAGKSSLINLLNTTFKVHNGEIEWNHFKYSDCAKFRTKIATIYQHPPFPEDQSIYHAITAGRIGQWSLGTTLRDYFLKSSRIEVERILYDLKINKSANEKVKNLSGGQKQRISIARMVFQNPDFILADEPISSLDPVLAEEMLQFVIEYAHKYKKTLIVSLHSLEYAKKYFQRILGFREGALVFDNKEKSHANILNKDIFYV